MMMPTTLDLDPILTVLPYLLGVISIAYLLGSLPTGYLAGKWLKGIDLREMGSGSTGATNVLRNLGKVPGGIVLAIDALKGVLAISCARAVETIDVSIFDRWESILVAVAAAAVIIGHSKSVWLSFKGGKSISTSLGVLLTMCWPVGLATLGVFAIVMAGSRIVSLSSILGAGSATVWMVVFHQPIAFIVFTIVGGVYVIWLHRANIQRLQAGTEPKLGQKLTDANS
jgi:acyl phosphate:glycerol-3-phosphate acyltransferase